MYNKLFKILLIILAIMTYSIAGELKVNGPLLKPTTLGLVENMNINNIDLPIKNDGSTGEDAQAYYPNGQTDLSFLFQGGFATTGFVNGELRASWMAAASLIEEWQPGTWGMDPTDALAKFYVVNSDDEQGSQAYIDWADAVSLGADFQDLNGDGLYDPFIDRPDMLGDRIIWCPVNDGTDIAKRTPRLNTDPIGLEIHLMIFAFARADELGDVVFFRYRLINPTNDDVDDIIFSVWEDPDMGDADDDLIGCDTTLSLGYVYNGDADDAQYGSNPPAHGVDFFQGPVVESIGDTAYLFRGPFFGIDTLYDKKNLPMTSFMWYINGHPDIPDPNTAEMARNYQTGGVDAQGEDLNPMLWGLGADANTDPRFVYAGDPGNDDVSRDADGWRDTTPSDKRMLINCGPFQLAAGDTQDIVASYVVAQGISARGSVDKLKQTDIVAQSAYNANFFIAGPPPAPIVSARELDEKIELVINLEEAGTFDYDQIDKLLNRQVFEAIRIYQFNAQSSADFIGSTQNAKVIAEFDLNNEYGDLFLPNPDGTIEKIWSGQNNLDTADFSDPGSAILKFTIDKDVFNNSQPLINNTEYYFAVTVFSLNYTFADSFLASPIDKAILVSGKADFLESSRSSTFLRAMPGTSEFDPFRVESGNYSGSRQFHEGGVFVDLVDKDLVTGHDYKVSFFDDGSLWNLRDEDTGETLLDSMTVQALSREQWSFPIFDGISMKVVNVIDALDTALVSSGTEWVRGETDLVKSFFYDDNSVYKHRISTMKNEYPHMSTIKKHEYFPIRVDFDSTNLGKGFSYTPSDAHGFDRRRFDAARSGVRDVFVKAFDISDPQNERQLNIAFTRAGNPAQTTAGQMIVDGDKQIAIMTSSYDTTKAYSGLARNDSLFKAETYVILKLIPTIPMDDSLFQFSQFSMTIKPYYPNSDLDSYTFSTSELLKDLSVSERKELLDKVKVVPNPYFAYSRYETSYDDPKVRFTHLDKVFTIRIFNLAGQLVRTLNNQNFDEDIPYWDLRNEATLKVASGMYIAHIEVPGVGSKILKFAILQREERIDRF
jgi:hypothetical protein